MLQKKYQMIAKYKNKIIIGIFFLAAFFLRIFYISKVKGPIVYTDELGYCGHAAALTGNTWSGVMGNMPWYAFGYSLLLAPLFLLSTDIAVMYKMAVILNMILGLLNYWIAYKVIRKAMPEVSKGMSAGVIAFTATSYSAYIFHSYIAWSETLLTFLVWLILYELISLEEKPGYTKSILLGATAGYAYMVHNRMLAVAAAVLLTTIFLVWSKKIKVQHFLLVLFALIALFLLSSMGKNYLEDLLVSNTVQPSMGGANISFGKTNTLSDQIGKVKEILTIDGMKKFLLNAIGQVWQILSATYLIAGFGIAFCIDKGIKAIREKKNISFCLFPFMALAATIAMTSLFFIEGSAVSADSAVRIDTFFYGRYNDILMGVFIMMALLFFHLEKERKTYCIYCIPVYAIYLTASFVIYYNLKDIKSFYINTVSAVSIYVFHWLGDFAVWKCALITFCVSVLCLISGLIKMPKHINRYIISLVLVFFFSTTALKCMRFVIRGENDYIQQYTEIFDFLNENTEKRDVIYTTMSGKPAYDLQTRVVDKAVISIDKGQEDLVTGSYYIVIPEQDYSDYNGTDYTMCLQIKDYIIIHREVQ